MGGVGAFHQQRLKDRTIYKNFNGLLVSGAAPCGGLLAIPYEWSLDGAACCESAMSTMLWSVRMPCFQLVCAMTLVSCLAVMSGCGGGGEVEDDRPDRTPVSGTVLLDGAPIEGAVITFHTESATGRGANGRSDSSGAFQMGTFEATDGVLPGNYQVTVTKMSAASAASQVSEDDPNYDPNAGVDAEPKNELPAKYADPQQSALTITVGTEPITDAKFELSK